jgi:hypothetical protein
VENSAATHAAATANQRVSGVSSIWLEIVNHYIVMVNNLDLLSALAANSFRVIRPAAFADDGVLEGDALGRVVAEDCEPTIALGQSLHCNG